VNCVAHDRLPIVALAPIIVATNHLRHAINAQRVRHCAALRGERVFQWHTDTQLRRTPAGYANGDQPTQQEMDHIMLHDGDIMRQLFMRGAPCVLTSNDCLPLGAANGARALLHSLVFSDEHVHSVQHSIDVAAAQGAAAGIIVDVPVPAYVNVAIEIVHRGGSDGASASRYAHFHTEVINARPHVIIPLALQRQQETLTQPPPSYESGFSRTAFGYDLAFAVTFFKVQGGTLERAIVDLQYTAHPQLTFESFLVGISRVRSAANLRVATFHVGGGSLQSTLHYLNRLQPRAAYAVWRRGFDASGTWRAELAAAARDAWNLPSAAAAASNTRRPARSASARHRSSTTATAATTGRNNANAAARTDNAPLLAAGRARSRSVAHAATHGAASTATPAATAQREAALHTRPRAPAHAIPPMPDINGDTGTFAQWYILYGETLSDILCPFLADVFQLPLHDGIAAPAPIQRPQPQRSDARIQRETQTARVREWWPSYDHDVLLFRTHYHGVHTLATVFPHATYGHVDAGLQSNIINDIVDVGFYERLYAVIHAYARAHHAPNAGTRNR
jgi:hypothetical protein